MDLNEKENQTLTQMKENLKKLSLKASILIFKKKRKVNKYFLNFYLKQKRHLIIKRKNLQYQKFSIQNY